jgi:murein DD-endopeptidase MepM/ murein hydrolase activator NlpD
LRTLGSISITGKHAGHWLSHRRRLLTSLVVVALAGFGVTAFGIAPLSTDEAPLPRRVISEPLQLPGLDAQVDALAAQELELTRTTVTQSGDTVDRLLQRLGVSDPAATTFLKTDRTARRVIEGRTGKSVAARADRTGALVELVARYPAQRDDQYKTHFTRLTVAASPSGDWHSNVETVPLTPRLRMGSGTIHSSLFAATDAAGLPDAVAVQMAELFSGEIDFHRELRDGDRFTVVYEALTADGEPIKWSGGTGKVLAAEFVNAGRLYTAFWFQSEHGGKGGYYDASGRSLKRMFLASPMEFSRVTSGFRMRFHPIFKTWRRHLGVDYGAPTGTSVRTVGDGVVSYAGWQNGYGNVVKVAHGAQRETTYAHLSRISVRRGQRVEQGQRVGAVGATGWATGPHLHFEFRVNGQHQNPLKIARTAEAASLDATAAREFAAVAPGLQGQLDLARTIDGVLLD